MKLENGYKIMYSAYERVTEQKPGPLYAAKGLPSVTDAMLISYDNAGQYVNCKEFKLIYDDGEHLWGSRSGVPSDEDVNIIIKAGNEIVFGKQIPVAAQQARIAIEAIVEPAVVEEAEPVVEQIVEEPIIEEQFEDMPFFEEEQQ